MRLFIILCSLFAASLVSSDGPLSEGSVQVATDTSVNSTISADFAIPAPPQAGDIEAAVEESRAQQKAVGATYSNDWSGILWFIAWWGFILVASLWWLSRKKAWLTREKQQRFEELVYGGAGAVARFVNQRLPRTVRRSSSGVIDHAHMTRLSEMPFDDLAAPRNGESTSTQIVGRRTTPEGSVGSTTPPLQE